MPTASTRHVIESFFTRVRSGLAPDEAADWMHDPVAAHQLASEAPQTVQRRPADYAAHVREFQQLWGPFQLHIDALLVDGDLAYVRWTQTGQHLGSFAGEPPSGRPLRETASATYRVVDGRIAEYWMQLDRQGLAAQLAAP